MTRARRLVTASWSLFVLGVLGSPRAARADPFHAQTLPLGQRAIGMGGAFTAIAADPSAVYYNPAGVALTNGAALSASLTLTAFDKSTVKGGYRTENGHSTLDHNAGASLPVFVSAVTQLGPRDADGVRKHGIALSTFTVGSRKLGYDVEVRSPSAGADRLETLSVDSAERTIWHALSYAYRPHRNLAFGFSGILSIERARYQDERISTDLGAVDPVERRFASSRSDWTSHLVSRNVKSLLGRFGLMYRVTDQLRIGMMFQPPSIHVRGRANVRERALTTQLGDPSESSFYNANARKVGASGPIPWELRLGASYVASSWLLFSSDVSLYGPTGSARNPVIGVAPRAPDRETGAVAGVGSFYAETWYRTWNGNIALGAEATFRESIALRAGVYTDLSSAPTPPRFSARYQPADVNRVGGSLSLGLVNDGYDISIGAIGLFGRGRGLSFNADPSTPDDAYQRTHVTDRMFFVFLNGVRSAVRAIAKKTDEKLREMLGPPLPEPAPKDEPRRPEPAR